MISKYRFKTYAPFGAETGQITHPGEWSFGSPYNEVSGLNLSHRDDMPNADRLQAVCEVGAEWSTDGVTWTEPPNGRFLRLGRGRVIRGQDKVRKYVMPGLGHLLKKVTQTVSTGLNADNKRAFNSANAGEIVKTLIDENKAAGGAMVGISLDFTITTDSSGAPWAEIITIGYEPGLDLYTILDNLSAQGMVDWYFQGRTLRMFNTSYLDVERPVNLKAGVDVNGIPVDASLDNLVHDAIIFGDAGVRADIASAYSPPIYWGRWQATISNSGVTDPATMNLLADQLLQNGSQEKIQYKLEMAVKKTIWEPFRDFVPGNRIIAPNEAGSSEAFRIPAIEVSRSTDGKIAVTLIANDRFVAAEVTRAKKVNGIAGGSVAGGSGTRPSPPEPLARTPKAPVGVVVSSVAVPNPSGIPRAIATVDWANVTQDVDNVELDIDSYEVQAYLEVETVPVSWGTSGASILSKNELAPGSSWSVEVRAVSSTGVKGAWSYPRITHIMATDTTAPGVPMFAAGDVTSALGTATIRWNGKAAGSADMPPDLAAVRVWRQGVSAHVAEMVSAGYETIGGLTPGTTYSFALSAIDRVGNESARTSYYPVTVVSAALDAGIQAELDALQADLEAGIGDMVQDAAGGIGKVIYSINDPSGDYPLGSTWYKRGANQQIVGQWEYIENAGDATFGGDDFVDMFVDAFGSTTYLGQWVAVTLNNAVLANVDAGKITTGELDGARIRAGSIRTDRLSVGLQDNLVPDPIFTSADVNAARAGLGWFYDAGTRSFANTTQITQRLSLAAQGPASYYLSTVQVVPGENYYLQATVTSTITEQLVFSMQTFDAIGNQGAVNSLSPSTVIPANTPTAVGVVWTVPAGVFFVNPGIQLMVPGTGRVDVTLPSMVRQTSAVVIENGAITTPKLAAGAVLATNIEAGAFNGMVVTAPTIRTAPSGSRIQLDSQGVRLYAGTALKVWMSPELGQLRLYSTGDIDHSSTGHAFQVGDDDNLNLAIDNNEIMARNAGYFGTLFINREGGNVAIGGQPGGFPYGTLPYLDKTDNFVVSLRGSIQVFNQNDGDYNDNWAPFMVGARGAEHLWMDYQSIGSATASGGKTLFLNPNYEDGSTHVNGVVLGSDSCLIRRVGANQFMVGGYQGTGDVALQFTGGQVNSRDTNISGNRSMGATAFNVISQGDTKKDVRDIPDPIAVLKAVKARKWKFIDSVDPEDNWHFGPMLEDLPTDMHRPVDEKMGYDLASINGVLWEACRYLLNRLETVEGKARDILTDHGARLDQAQTALQNQNTRIKALEAR